MFTTQISRLPKLPGLNPPGEAQPAAVLRTPRGLSCTPQRGEHTDTTVRMVRLIHTLVDAWTLPKTLDLEQETSKGERAQCSPTHWRKSRLGGCFITWKFSGIAAFPLKAWCPNPASAHTTVPQSLCSTEGREESHSPSVIPQSRCLWPSEHSAPQLCLSASPWAPTWSTPCTRPSSRVTAASCFPACLSPRFPEGNNLVKTR